MTMTETGRSVERIITVDATTEAVWKALTDAEELIRWFPLDARVEPGKGGSIYASWGEEVYEGTSRILEWEPERRLKITFPEEGPNPLITDYHISTEQGKTVLRVVTSGFGEGAEWDDQYEGVSNGWDFELAGLKHYLENHYGTPRRMIFLNRPYQGGREQAWNKLTGPGGWFGAKGLASAAEGERLEIQRANDTISGQVLFNRPNRMFVTTVEEANDGLLRLELYGGDQGAAWIQLSTYGMSDDRVTEIESRWLKEMEGALA